VPQEPTLTALVGDLVDGNSVVLVVRGLSNRPRRGWRRRSTDAYAAVTATFAQEAARVGRDARAADMATAVLLSASVMS